MATLKDYDGLLLSFNDKFLTNLIKERYRLSNIRFKFLSYNRSPLYKTFVDYNAFYDYFKSILNDPQRACLSGKFPVLDGISLANESLKFQNEYKIRSITTNIFIQTDYKFDGYRKDFYQSQVDSYKRYLEKRFANYIIDISTLTKVRTSTYIDSCYIDPNYFEGDIDIQLLSI